MEKLTEVQKCWFALAQTKGVGPIHYRNIRFLFKSPSDFLSAPAKVLSSLKLEKIHGEFSKQADKKRLQFSDTLIQKHLEQNIQILSLDSPLYPSMLRAIPNPPPFLFVKGKLPQSQPSCAIVGTRRPSSGGLTLARRISTGLSQHSWTVISGLADGIDTAAHWASLESGGTSLAVIGTGHDVCYPSFNGELQNRLFREGCVISEYPLGTRPATHHFPARNRLVSGLSWATVVIEAGVKSGALITAKNALQYKRKLFSVPGSPLNMSCSGSNQLLKHGANLACSWQDIHFHFFNKAVPSKTNANPKGPLNQKESEVLQKMGKSSSISQLNSVCNSTLGELIIILMQLETKGFIKRSAGSSYSKVH